MWSKPVHQQEKKCEIHLLVLIPRSLPVPWSGPHGTAIRQAAADAAYQHASMGRTDNTCADSVASCGWHNGHVLLPFPSEETDVHCTHSPTCDFHHLSPWWPWRGILSTSQQENCSTAHCCAQQHYSTDTVTSFSASCDFFGREMLELT